MYITIDLFLQNCISKFDAIPIERKLLLQQISNFIQQKKDSNEYIQLVYVCTHNSRRSHFGQIAASIASAYYQIENVYTYSGGTEATAFHPNAIDALTALGFKIIKENDNLNPLYKVNFGDDKFTTCFSKIYNDDANPKNNFAAIMTCSDADENCPIIPGVELRIGTTYEDPKKSDGTAMQQETYQNRFIQICTETMYVFSLIK